MKNIKHLLKLTILLFTIMSCKAQNQNNSNLNISELILGEWVAEDSNINNKWVFNSSNTAIRFYDGQIYKTYHWSINENNTPSGLKFHSLELVNINDSSDIYRYEINSLTNDMMILVYQRPGGGISRLNKFYKLEE